MGSLVVDSLGEPVTSVAFSQDSQCVLVSTLDNTIRLMDKATGELLNEYVLYALYLHLILSSSINIHYYKITMI